MPCNWCLPFSGANLRVSCLWCLCVGSIGATDPHQVTIVERKRGHRSLGLRVGCLLARKSTGFRREGFQYGVFQISVRILDTEFLRAKLDLDELNRRCASLVPIGPVLLPKVRRPAATFSPWRKSISVLKSEKHRTEIRLAKTFKLFTR